MPAFAKEQSKRPVYNGRPQENSGLPIGLFHPVFNDFHAAMRSTEALYAGEKTYSAVRGLFQACADLYDSEEKRVKAVNPFISELLEISFASNKEAGVNSDGVVTEHCGTSMAYVAIQEVKNEIGTASADPYNQGSLAYRKYWAAESKLGWSLQTPSSLTREPCAANKKLREACYCPTIMLAIAGPWMCVFGGVYLQKATVQPLTDYIWLGGNNFNDDRLIFASRLFAALKCAIKSLQEYYRGLSSNFPHWIPITVTPNPFPCITHFGSTNFTYSSRLANAYREKLIYRANLEGDQRSVVVKFVSRYNAQAHRILAEHHLAPKLHYAGTEEDEIQLYGGRYMVVMDYFDGEPVTKAFSEQYLAKVNTAIRILHSHNLVFGDLRRPNILIKGETVMLVDFDWCGEAGVARYPKSLNPDPEICWHESVGPDCIMMKEHDIHMLGQLLYDID